ncbi:MAG: hypothetical protein KBB52_06495 [Candidatus Omnitrophica bacterium]|nr:hypothetical protein [Candidatus Omnitrophota bacterium]
MDITQSRIKITSILQSVSILLFIVVAVRWFVYVDRYSINIMFWDQWDFFDAFFGVNSIWDTFKWQHGPHRQGLGLILTKTVGQISGWDTRIECLLIGGLIFLTMCLAIILKKRLAGKITWSDVVIALIFLTPVQSEIFAMTPNMSHSAIPLMLIVLYAMAWTIKRLPLRYISVLSLNFLLIFTGFGLSVFAVTPLLFAIDMIKALIDKDEIGFVSAFLALAVSVLSCVSYLAGYKFDPGVADFKFPAADFLARYPRFIFSLLANFLQFKAGYAASTMWAGFTVFASMAFICLLNIKKLLAGNTGDRQHWLSRSIVILTLYTLTFCVLTAIGRVKQGPFISRYMPYLIPGFFAVYLQITQVTGKKAFERYKNYVLALTVVIFFVGSFPLNRWDSYAFETYLNGKKIWVDYYLRHEDIDIAEMASRFKIYPDPAKTNLKAKLDHLKKNRFNLYL